MYPGYDPSRHFTPDLSTEQVVEHFEKHLAPTVHFQQELTRLGKWDPNWVLDPVRSVGFGHTYGDNVRYSGHTQPPQKDKSNLGQALKINRTTYPVGMGVHAPCALMYQIKPDYKRFVALAGADENLVSISNGSNLAKYPSVVFKVFICSQLKCHRVQAAIPSSRSCQASSTRGSTSPRALTVINSSPSSTSTQSRRFRAETAPAVV